MITSTTTTSSEALTVQDRQRIFLVDDHPLFIYGLRQLLESEPDLTVCGQAASAPKALSALRTARADLAIVDVSLDGTDGLELIKHLQAEQPKLPLLVLSVHDERQYAPRALRAGARGYVMKTLAVEALLPAVRRVLRGQIALSPAMSEELIAGFVRGPREETLIDTLSDRELEVLQLIGVGRSSTDIAARLNLNIKTVESHRLNLRHKLKLKSSSEMGLFAAEWAEKEAVGGAAA